MATLCKKFCSAIWLTSFASVCAISMMLYASPSEAADAVVPWECTGFTGESQDRCVRVFYELQQEKIAKLEKELDLQKQTVQQLEQHVAQQASATAKLERQLSRSRSRWYNNMSPAYAVPPIGLSLRLGHFGRSRLWGGSLFYGMPRYFGPRFYGFQGYGHRHWFGY